MSCGRSHALTTSTGSECPGWRGEVLVDHNAHVIYVDNVKAGSTTVRKFFQRRGIEWDQWQCNNHGEWTKNAAPTVNDCFPCRQREMGTCCWTRQLSCMHPQHPKWVWFSIVREPIRKFESGVHQAKFENPQLRHFSADELLARQLQSPAGRWVNEHFMPSSCRLKVRAANGVAHLNFTAKLETAAEDIRMFVPRLKSSIQRSFFAELASALRENVTLSSAQLDEKNPLLVPYQMNNKLSRDGVERFANSSIFGRDFDLYCYEHPLG